MTVYLLHFSDPIAPGRHTCQHYLGYADDLAPRVHAHAHGAGARLTQVAHERGLTFVVARIWEGDRTLERQLKNRHDGRRLCPLCNGRRPVQMPLLLGVCAFTPTAESEGTMIDPDAKYVTDDALLRALLSERKDGAS